MTFLWRPGTGPNEDALARMRAYLPQPKAPMGEAWFMGDERKLHRELFAVGAAKLDLLDLNSALWDIASGTQCFGHREEWDAWLRYMLPDLVVRSHEQYTFDLMIEYTITAFIAIHWTGIREEYPGFTRDVLLTLGHALMEPALWAPHPEEPNNPMKRTPLFLRYEDRGEDLLYGWGSSNAPGSVASAIVFCAKYLPEADLRSWAAGLFDIEHPQWRFALLVWYVGAQTLRTRPFPTSRDFEKAAPQISWQNSHVLGSAKKGLDGDPSPAPAHNRNHDFLDAARVGSVLDTMREQLSVDRLAAWEATFWTDPLLAADPALPSILNRALATLAA